VSVAVVLVIALFVSFMSVTEEQRRIARQTVKQLHAATDIGASRRDVEQRLRQAAGARNKMITTDDAIYFKTPMELGATEWIMTVRFREQQVTSVFTRVADGNYWPCDAPADKGGDLSRAESFQGKPCY
jgi:hypothetical protein